MSKRPACFLDRDGVLIHDVGYLSDPADIALIDGAAEAVRRLNEADIATVVVSNQSGIARGFFDEERLAEVHDHLVALLAKHGAHLDAIHYCPHHPTEGKDPYRVQCECRAA